MHRKGSRVHPSHRLFGSAIRQQPVVPSNYLDARPGRLITGAGAMDATHPKAAGD